MENTNEEKYKSYLQTISIIAFGTAIMELPLLFTYGDSGLVFKRGMQLEIGIVSILLLAVAGFLGMAIASGLSINDQIDDFFNNIDKGRAVTALFFIHLLGVTLFIIQDGGAQASCISNILLVDASLGYFFAAKKKVKRAVNVIFFIVYSICLIFYIAPASYSLDTAIIAKALYYSRRGPEGGKLVVCFDFGSIPHFLAVLFVIGVNVIINSQISSKNTDI